MPPHLFVIVTEQPAAASVSCDRSPQRLGHHAQGLASIVARHVRQHHRYGASLVDDIRVRQASQSPHAKRRDAEMEGRLALSGPRYFSRSIRAMGSQSPNRPGYGLPCHRKHQIPAEAPPLCTAVDDRRSRASHNLKVVGWSRAQCRTNVMLSAVRKSCRFSLFALQMFFALCEILLIYFVATVLFLAIHHYECNGRLATLFKCLVLAVGGVAIINKLQPVLGLNWF